MVTTCTFMPAKRKTYAERYGRVKPSCTTLRYKDKVRFLSYCEKNDTTEASVNRRLILKLLDGEIKL